MARHPRKELVLKHVERILASEAFRKGAGTARVLQFVVNAALDGRPIKEFDIATEALGRRPEKFDPNIDNVRGTVRDLRAKLDEYYASEGSAELIRIKVPKGGYRAVFSQLDRATLSTPVLKPPLDKLEPSIPPRGKQTPPNCLIQESRLLLKRYYPDSDLRAQNLFRYSYVVDGPTIITNIVSSGQWLELALPVGETDHEKFPIQDPLPSLVPVSDAEVDSLRLELESKNVPFHNKAIYCLRSFDPHGQAIAYFSMAQYADYKIKLGRLEEETTQALVRSNFSAKAAFSKRHTLMRSRRKLLGTSRVIANYGDRLCAGGTNVLFALRRPDCEGFTFYVKRRSGEVSTGQKAFSLIPSGMHQPVTGANAREETSVAATVYRETWEELFGGKDVEGEDEHYKPLWFMSKPQLAWFRKNRGSFRLEIVSFGLNLMDGTFEFGVLFVVHDPSYWEEFADGIVPNREFKDSKTAPFDTTDTMRLASILTEPQFADTSRIALIEGLRRLQHLEPRNVKLPDIEIIK